MDKKILKQYASIQKEINELTLELGKLKEVILTELKNSGVGKLNHEEGTFSVISTKKWTYSGVVIKKEEAIQQAKKKLDTLKAKEQENGSAQFTETETLRFTPSKE